MEGNARQDYGEKKMGVNQETGRIGKGRKNRIKNILGAMAGGLALLLLVVAAVRGIREDQKRQRFEARGEVTIVVFGDSIWDICRDETGIAAVLEKELKTADIVNCCMMGTSAAYRQERPEETPEETQEWNRKSLMGILNSGNPQQVVSQYTPVTEIPLEEADYIVLAYGLNDYFCGIPRESEDSCDPDTYAGALHLAVLKLRECNPKAEIFLLSQTYCQGYAYGKVDSESDYKDYGGGTGPDYVAAIEAVAEEMGCVFVNNYKDMGINIHNGPKYLSDATHLTEYGRKKYAKNLAKYILEESSRLP